MLHVAFPAPGGFQAQLHGSNTPLSPTNRVLQHGRYIFTPSLPGEEMHTSDETFFPRTLSWSSTGRVAAFRDKIRSRGRHCVIAGQPSFSAANNRWTGFEVAHIFPLAFNDTFTSQDTPSSSQTMIHPK